MTDPASSDDVPLPQLMREARGAYGDAARRALGDAGCDDIPRNGGVVLSILQWSAASSEFSPQAGVVATLGLSKQAVSQVIDTLVLREYLERRPDPEDRRRMGVRLTERGRMAGLAIQMAPDEVDAELAQRVTADELRGLRAGLAALREIRKRSSD